MIGADAIDALLTALRGERLSVGVTEAMRIRHVLSLGAAESERSLTTLLACLVARTSEERDAVGRAVRWWTHAGSVVLDRELKNRHRGSTHDSEEDVLLKEPSAATEDIQVRAAPTLDLPNTAAPVSRMKEPPSRLQRSLLLALAALVAASIAVLAWLAFFTDLLTSTTAVDPGKDPSPRTSYIGPMSVSAVVVRIGVALVAAIVVASIALTRRKDKWLTESDAVSIQPSLLDLPPRPLFVRTSLLFTPNEQQDIVDGLGSVVTERRTADLDGHGTVRATCASAGLPRLCFRLRREIKTVWLWIDSTSQDSLMLRTAFELHTMLVQGGIPVELALFGGIPSPASLYRASFSEDGAIRGPHPHLPPGELGEDPDHVVVAILTDGHLMSRAMAGTRRQAVTRSLAALRRFGQLAVTDFSRGERGLPALAEEHRLTCLAPEQLPAFFAGEQDLSGDMGFAEPHDPRDRTGLRALSGATRTWAAACALAPRGADEDTALALRAHLGLRAPTWSLPQVLSVLAPSADASAENARSHLLSWLWTSEEDGTGAKSTLRRALAFWETRYLDTPLDLALLHLWETPDRPDHKLARAVDVLWSRRETRAGSRACAAVKQHATRPERGGVLRNAEGKIVLPWRWSELAWMPETRKKLAEMGLGSVEEPPPKERFRMPGTVALALGIGGGVAIGAVVAGVGSVALVMGVVLGVVGAVGVVMVRGRISVPSPPGPLSPSGRGGVAEGLLGDDLGDGPQPPGPSPLRGEGERGEGLLEMVDLAGGEFWMGSKDDDKEAADDQKPRHRVKVAPFSIGRYPVTQRQYREVMGDNPGDPQGDDLPINRVSWFDAVAFCNKLSEREGLTPAYRVVANGNKEEVSWDAAADGYRLPTEAEWEYACRAGTETKWSFGDDETQLGEHAWYRQNAEGRIQPVGTKQPNPWRLFDMHGNVWEWCWDWFGAYPTPPSVGGLRVLRGGSWFDGPWGLRSAFRGWDWPTLRVRYIGFRAVRGVSRQHGG